MLARVHGVHVALIGDASSRDPATPPDVLPGSGVIVPIAHLPSPFDFSAEEWAAVHDLLLRAKAVWDERLAPDGLKAAGQRQTCADLDRVLRSRARDADSTRSRGRGNSLQQVPAQHLSLPSP